jgi:hypothetical protein
MHTIVRDPHPPNPAAPWLVRTSYGYEWHAKDQTTAETQLREHIAERRLSETETALIAALHAYAEVLPDCADNVRDHSYSHVRRAVDKHLPAGCIPQYNSNWSGPPTYIA